MRRKATILTWLGCLLLAAGCRHQNIHAVGAFGRAPYQALSCREPGNLEGFSFEVPEESCPIGIRLRYLAVRGADGTMRIQYEQEVSYRDDDPGNDVLMLASGFGDLERLFIGSREIDPGERLDPDDQDAWTRYREIFRMTWENYAVLLPQMSRVCAEERLEADPTG